MDQLPKILQNLPRVIEQPNIPAGVQQALSSATGGLASVKQTISDQKAAIERSLEIDDEYERKMAFYENLRNTAEDIGDPEHPK